MEYSERVGARTRIEDYQVAIGLIESASIAAGVLITDAVLKASPVEVLWARTISPGRWLTLFTGEVEEVNAALEAGLQAGGGDVCDDLFIPQLDPQVPPAIRGPRSDVAIDALGIVEFSHIPSAVVAADAAVKTAEVELVELRLGQHLGGKGFFIITGAIADVEDAVAVAAAVGHDRQSLVRDVVVTRADEALIPFLRP